MCDKPDENLEKWDANLQFQHPENLTQVIPLTINNLLLRGCFLRNTEQCYGIVCYLGKRTKIMMNAKKPSRKVSHMMKMMNYMLYTVFAF